jgi:hypothetical protein
MGRDTKQADIVLKGNDFGIVIEMKRPDNDLNNGEEIQLFSYMRFLRHKYGLLIGKKVKVFYDDDDANNDNPLEIASFGFDDNNTEGIALGNILDKANCSNEKLKEYAAERIKRNQTVRKLKHLKNELAAKGGEKIKEIVKNKLIDDGYEEKDVLAILDDIFRAFVPGPGYNDGNKFTGIKPVIINNNPALDNNANKPMLHQLFDKILEEYREITILKNSANWIIFSTQEMDVLLPPDSFKKGSSWSDGRKYHYWFNLKELSNSELWFELGPQNQDGLTINTMNKITNLFGKKSVSSDVDQYRRIKKWTLNLGLDTITNAVNIENEIRRVISDLFKWESNCLQNMQ